MITSFDELESQGAKFYYDPHQDKEIDPPHYYAIDNKCWTLINIDEDGTPEYMGIQFELIAYPELFT